MKEVVLDTETTGLSVKEGHRIVEIGCIELDDLIPTKNKFHYYLNLKEKSLKKPLIFMVTQMIFFPNKKNSKI